MDPIVDYKRSATLDTTWLAAVTVLPNGEEQLWLVRRGHRGRKGIGCCCPRCAPHEHPDRPAPRIEA